jgi:hypothetical protein
MQIAFLKMLSLGIFGPLFNFCQFKNRGVKLVIDITLKRSFHKYKLIEFETNNSPIIWLFMQIRKKYVILRLKQYAKASK